MGPPRPGFSQRNSAALRVQIALTGVLVALLLIGLGSLVDRRTPKGTKFTDA